MHPAVFTPQEFRSKFLEAASVDEHAATLKEAALNRQNKQWTEALTFVVVETVKRLGCLAAAKGHKFELLPEARNEYLGIDVMAFAKNSDIWKFPLAAIELENSKKTERVAYSLWKVLSIRAKFRVVFCYRPEPGDAPELIRHLKENIVSAIEIEEMMRLEGETIVVVGYRNNAETFPYGFFKWWSLNKNTRSFELLD
jgi:hypothetical protein